jgi:hypothetical protein
MTGVVVPTGVKGMGVGLFTAPTGGLGVLVEINPFEAELFVDGKDGTGAMLVELGGNETAIGVKAVVLIGGVDVGAMEVGATGTGAIPLVVAMTGMIPTEPTLELVGVATEMGALVTTGVATGLGVATAEVFVTTGAEEMVFIGAEVTTGADGAAGAIAADGLGLDAPGGGI